MGEITAGLRRAAWMGAAALLALLILAGLFRLSPGDAERLARSAGQMEAAARTLGEGESLGPREFGDLTFEDVYRDDGVVFFRRGRVAEEPHGFAWSPRRRPVDVAAEGLAHVFEHERGPWYSWRGMT